MLNLCAASLVLLCLTVSFNLNSATIQGFRVVISLLGIARLNWTNRRMLFTGEEKALPGADCPDMPRPIARRFLNLGNWIDAEAGACLLREGAPVTNLHFLADGAVRFRSGGQMISHADSGLLES